MADKLTSKTFLWNAFSPSDIVSLFETPKFIRVFTNLSISLYSEPLECSPLSHTFIFMIHFNIIFLYTLAFPKKRLSDFSINILWVYRIAHSFFVFSIPHWSEHAKIILKQLKNVLLWYKIFQHPSIPSICSFKLLSSGSKSEMLSVPTLPLMGETNLPTVGKIRLFFVCNECI